ncbi:MAG TPA: radical SAM family heme chaperone HemW [Gaiellaceae bacterium]|nr:radical SAM family heme chaperone HemW [Gaiellaceae bacterium]
MSARHLYVHLPFCAHRCGYCDFVTATGRDHLHGPYVDALLRELDEEHDGSPVETIFLGGGTPTFTALPELLRLLRALPSTRELTVEANPETVTPELAHELRGAGVNRVSLGAQTFQPHLLNVLERRATPADVDRAFGRLREAGFDNLSLDLIYGIPGQTPEELAADLAHAIELGPEHISAYELEAKPGTRFTIAHGAELERQAEQMEDYFERVVATLTTAGYRWYETANFCRDGKRAEHNLAYWLGRDYLGLGVGAVSTLDGERRRNTPKLARYLQGHYDRQIELLDERTRARERVMLGLRLDEPLALGGLRSALDTEGLARAEQLGLAVDAGETLALTRRGRFLGGGVTAEILA